LPYHGVELVNESSAEDCEVGVIHVHHVES
jgi:hypothetical protein